jgi:hypothetical protein
MLCQESAENNDPVWLKAKNCCCTESLGGRAEGEPPRITEVGMQRTGVPPEEDTQNDQSTQRAGLRHCENVLDELSVTQAQRIRDSKQCDHAHCQ